MTLNELFAREEINAEDVIVLRHRPFEPELAKVLGWLAAEHPTVFNAYQQTQGPILEKSMLKLAGKGYVASFLAHGAGKAIFVGLYTVKASHRLTLEQYWDVPAYQQMKQYGMIGFTAAEDRPTIEWFDLELTPFRSEWKGKLIIDWPGGERSWWRRAENNDFSVLAILEESTFDKGMPEWDKISLPWDQLEVMPRSWQERLSLWRGIYYIFDELACKGYVGSACGGENILGRWKNYSANGHGGNRLLRELDPKSFRFSILELVSPTMEISDLIARENSWKERLRTRSPFGLNDN